MYFKDGSLGVLSSEIMMYFRNGSLGVLSSEIMMYFRNGFSRRPFIRDYDVF